jgi:hypothetical protein
VEEVRERIDLLQAQLQLHAGRKRRSSGREIGRLQTEHQHLLGLWEQASRPLHDLLALEELALTAAAAGEDGLTLLGEARARYARLRQAALYLLLALPVERQRDQIALLVQELDDRRAFDLYLAPLCAADRLRSRGWQVTVHADGDGLPAERKGRFGPPRTADWALDQLQQEERPFRAVLLCVRGPWAGALLGLEQGRHCYRGGSGEARDAQLACLRIAYRTSFSDEEWAGPALRPMPTADPTGLPLARQVDLDQGQVFLPSGEAVSLEGASYWDRFEEIALLHLLQLDREDARDALERVRLAASQAEGA